MRSEGSERAAVGCRWKSVADLGATGSRLALALVFVTTLAALGTAAEAAAADGVLRVGTSGDYPPFSLAGEGFDVEVARRFAADMGWTVEWVAFRWPGLTAAVHEQRFDVAMSGVTWRPERAVVGYMTRAVAAGGPCLVGSASPRRVAVNRGGILERWARETLTGAEIVAVDDNLSLPRLLAAGEVEAFVTDSFEVRHLSRREWQATCEPSLDRKVYWVAPARASDLGPELDRWLAAHEQELQALRREIFGEPAGRDELDHLIDLVGRRLELMPAVAAWKRDHGLAIEVPERERLVLERAVAGGRERGLEAASVEGLFEVQMQLAKEIQRRHPADEAALDLDTQLRPVLLELGERILDSLAEVTPIDPGGFALERTLPWSRYLSEVERARLRRALLGVEAIPALRAVEPSRP